MSAYLGGNERKQEAFYMHISQIEDLYEVSGIQSVAVNAYINSILSTGLRFAADKTPARGMVLTTVVDWIRNLCLFGFCCYRILVDEEPESEDFAVQVPSGAQVPVRFSRSRLRWVPDLRSGNTANPLDVLSDVADESDDDDDITDPLRWRCVVWMPPTEQRCTSFAAQAYHDSVRIEELFKNSAERDAFNSRPSAYVTINDADFSTRGRAGGQPFLRSGLDIDPHTGEEGMTRGMKYGRPSRKFFTLSYCLDFFVPPVFFLLPVLATR